MVLEPVTPQNYREVLRLAVAPEQRRFVAPVVYSLAEAYVFEGSIALAAREGEAVVGFALLYPFDHEDAPAVLLVRFLIDATHQRRGHGRALMRAVLDYAAGLEPQPLRMKLGVLPDNAAAVALYEGFGFAGEAMEGEDRIMWRSLETAG